VPDFGAADGVALLDLSLAQYVEAKKGNAGKLLRHPGIKKKPIPSTATGPLRASDMLLPRASMIFHDFDIPRFSVFCFWGAVIPRAGSPSPPSADRPTPTGGLALPGAAKRKASWGGGKCAGRIRRGGGASRVPGSAKHDFFFARPKYNGQKKNHACAQPPRLCASMIFFWPA
jgi:hypothetical protein